MMEDWKIIYNSSILETKKLSDLVLRNNMGLKHNFGYGLSNIGKLSLKRKVAYGTLNIQKMTMAG